MKNQPAKNKPKPKSLRAVQPSKARADKANWGGKRRGAGRKTGSTNAFSRDIKESVIRAANRIGRDGKGTGGMDGYMERLALNNEPVFGGLLRGVMGTQVTIERPVQPVRTEQEIRDGLARMGLALEDLRPFKFHDVKQVDLELAAIDVTDDNDKKDNNT